MRVVAGELGGRRLRTPPDERARPTTDRVREAIFNALASRGGVDGARAVDLFAGTGALGIEALSRGAAHTTFVERDRAMAGVLRANLADLGLDGRGSAAGRAPSRATVVVAEARAWLSGLPVEAAFDLALLDPPYAFDDWAGLLAALPASRAVIESDRVPDVPPGWGVVRQKRYGSTIVTIVERGDGRDVGDT